MLLALFLNLLLLNSDSANLVKFNEYAGFKNAVSVTADGKGYIYVLDNESNEIVKLNDNLKIIKRSGKKGWGNSELDSPTNIDGSSGLDIYVCDPVNYRIQRFDLNLGFVSSLITNLPATDDRYKYNSPIASVIINSSSLYVIDGENKRIVYYPDGVIPGFYFGGFQSAQKPFQNPVKLLKDGSNNIYLFDNKASAVFIYDNMGNYIKTIENIPIKSVSIFNNIVYIFTGSELLLYDVRKNAFINRLFFAQNTSDLPVNDMLVYSDSKVILLEKNKIDFFTIK